VAVRFRRGRHRWADDHVVIGHERQHFDAEPVDVNEPVPSLRQREVDRAGLPEEFGELLGRVRRTDRLKIIFEPSSAIHAEEHRLP
jgi:hypothetical protein